MDKTITEYIYEPVGITVTEELVELFEDVSHILYEYADYNPQEKNIDLHNKFCTVVEFLQALIYEPQRNEAEEEYNAEVMQDILMEMHNVQR